MTAYRELTEGPRCSDCGWVTVSGLDYDTNPHCQAYLRWQAIAPAMPYGSCDARRQDRTWFAAHPDEAERVRALSVDEQLRIFARCGALVEFVQLFRVQTWDYFGWDKVAGRDAVLANAYW